MAIEPMSRRRRTLRDVCDEYLDHVRELSWKIEAMSEDERLQARERLDWLADETWRAILMQDQDIN